MAKYFGAPWQRPPTVQQTGAHYRARNIAAVIFPVIIVIAIVAFLVKGARSRGKAGV